MSKAWMFAIVVPVLCFALFPGEETDARTYTTNFPLTENPISEFGQWVNGQKDGVLWANCMTTNHFVWGNDNRGVQYADPTAILTGTWGSNQTVTATVRVVNQRTGGGCCSEIELRLRSKISTNSIRGYEILFSTYPGNDYVQIVTWHGPRGVEGVGFNYVASTSGKGAPINGDVVSASISNSTIRVYKNNSLILTGVNTEWSDGSPGVGFYGDSIANVGFSSFTATDGLSPPPGLLLSALLANGQFSLSFETVASQSYTILQNTNLAARNWIPISNFLGSGSPYQLSLPATNTPPRVFFRLREP